nr:MAG: nucleoprotein [Drosophila Burdiehouse burn chuvirus]
MSFTFLGFDGLKDTAIDNDDDALFPNSDKECRKVLICMFTHLVTAAVDNITRNIQTFVKTERFILLLNAASSTQAYKIYAETFDPTKIVDHIDFVDKMFEMNDLTPYILGSQLSNGTMMGFIGLVGLSYCKTGSAVSCYQRLKTAFVQAKMLMPPLIDEIFKIISGTILVGANQTDSIENYHNGLWRYKKLALGQIDYFLKRSGESEIEVAIMAQIRLVSQYSQMTYIKVTREFMTTSNSSARVYRPAVKEFRKLLQTLDEIKAANPDVEEGHFKLLRINGADKLDATKFPHLACIVSLILEQEARTKGRIFTISTVGMIMNNVKRAFEMQLPSEYSLMSTDLDDDDLNCVNLTKKKN